MTKTSRTGIGAASGCFVGLLSGYFFIGSLHNYVPSAALSLPWPLIGAGFGFFSDVEMSKHRGLPTPPPHTRTRAREKSLSFFRSAAVSVLPG